MGKDEIAISDLGLAASLTSLGHKVLHTNRDQKGRVSFVFIQDTLVEKAINDFWSDNLLVNPRNYYEQIRLLKNRIYGGV